MKSLKLYIAFFTFLLIIVPSSYVVYLFMWTYQGGDTVFKISPGESFASINYRLSKNQLISSPRLFHYMSKARGSLLKFRKGNFRIRDKSNMLDVFKILLYEGPIQISVTIPEGKNLYEIANILFQKNICNESQFIALAKNQTFAKKLNIPGPTIEGYLYPETYFFTEQTSPKEIISIMVSQFNKQTADLDFTKSSLNKHEVIILASIVEKETGAKKERSIIAGVFLNRLKKRMRLASDPTTIYGIWEQYDGNLKRKDLFEKTAYNTYKMAGLPLGPISNPGRDAIKAILEPQNHKFLYFVSKNDGTHVFSTNFKDHDKAVDYYQKTRANRVGKSWRDLKQ